ncbi:hypothetical protein PAHAL_9G094500 [Panicum hallii]|uniref:Uncharacterized protein n=1 Tax=Panicum hallii TaxID=206008 RepID=A0A2S3IIB9_9POAL|nr:uncharacterized protein LOC112873018 [Panicum hallii]PAN45117.1 hypothetical protein PAHAL_9G094500 [Panicum hallii]
MAGASGSSRLPTTKAFQTDSHLPSSSKSGNASLDRIPSLKFPFLWEPKNTHRISRGAEQRAALITLGAASFTPEKKLGRFLSEEVKNIDLLLPLAYEITRTMILRQFGAAQLALERQCWSKIAETIVHQAIVSCQTFTLIGVAGSLVGSVPLFAEGCVGVMKSFFMHFHAMSHTVDRGEIIKLLIEALDMFLMGTALLKFGMGMYIMFYGSQSIQTPAGHANTPHLGAFNLKKLKDGARIRSITQAKTRIGHAILRLLQVGVLEKFKSVPLVTGLDMACFAGAVVASSASVFLLSKLSMGQEQLKQSCA